MDLRQLRYFVSIAEKGSMSAASEHLGIAQPSLSQHVMRVEEELGLQLLVRSPRGITLTESGQRLYSHARNILQHVESAVADLRDSAGEPRGPVSFAFPSSVGNVLTVPLAETVRHEFPRIALRALQALSGDVQGLLTEGKIDFGVLYDAVPSRHLQVRSVLEEELYLIAPHDGWEGEIGPDGIALNPVPLSDIASLGLILPHRSHGLRDMIERFAHAQGFSIDVALEIDSLDQIKILVGRGSGYSVLAQSAVFEEVKRGSLILVPICEPSMTRVVNVVRNTTRPLTRAVSEVERLTIEIVEELVRKGHWRGRLLSAPPT